MEAIETFETDGFKVHIYHDDTPESPPDWDNPGHMVCWHRRSNLGDENVRTENYRTKEELEASFNARVCIPLYLYEHGSMTMRTYPFGDPWDSGQVGYIYVTDERLEKEYSVPPG